MSSRNKICIVVMAVLLALLYQGCAKPPTQTVLGGSGTEDDNSVAGVLFEKDGMPSGIARVWAVPEFYDHSLDSQYALSVETDSAGRFVMSGLKTGAYNIEALSARSGGRVLWTGIQVSASRVNLPAGTLAAPGAFSIPVSPKMRAGGYLYLNGTTRLHRLTGAEIAGGIARFDSIFTGRLPALCYALDGDTLSRSVLADSLVLAESQTMLLDTPFVARAVRLSNRPVIDGEIGEYAFISPLRVVKKNGSALYRLAYDDSALYVAIRVADRSLNAQVAIEDGEVWLDDCAGIFIDVAGNGGLGSDADDFKFWVSAAGIKRDVRGTTGPAWNAQIQYAVSLGGSLNENADIDTGYTVELRIRWSDIGILSPGQIRRMGFDAVMFDNDGPVWSPAGAWANTTGGDLNDPAGWGELVILP